MIFGRFASTHGCSELVECLGAISVGVPEIRLSDLERDGNVIHPRLEMNFLFAGRGVLALRSIVPNAYVNIGGRCRFNVQFRGELRYILRDLLLMNMEVIDAKVVPRVKIHR